VPDEDLIAKFILPARRFVEGGSGGPGPKGGQGAPAFSRSAMKSIDANVRRGREALAKALGEKTTVDRAMFRNGLDWVDFAWGDDEGAVKSNGKRLGERGIAHILKARHRKDGLLEGRAQRLLEGLVETIANGRELRRAEIGGATRAVIEWKNMQAVLVRNPGSNTWLLTGWELKPGATNAANDATGTTHRMADSSDHTAGAGSKIAAQNQPNGNSDIRYRGRTTLRYTQAAVGMMDSMTVGRWIVEKCWTSRMGAWLGLGVGVGQVMHSAVWVAPARRCRRCPGTADA
jgi:hypothetical protein